MQGMVSHGNAKPDPLHGRKVDLKGKHGNIHNAPPEFVKEAFMGWLLTPPKERDPRTIIDFAKKFNVTRRTLDEWQYRNKEFMEEWERRYLKTIGNPGRKQTIMDTLFRTATDADDPKHVQAAKTYFEIEGSMKPTRMQVEVSKSATELTDAELAAILNAKASDEVARRRQAS